MNYLQLCQRVHDIAGFQGQFASVDSLGYQAVVARAVEDAYEDIQRYRDDWDFLQAQKDITIGPSQQIYTLSQLGASDLSIWKYINFNYRRMQEMTHELWSLQDYSNWSGQEPLYWAWRPSDRALCISPVAENSVCTMYYIRTLHALTLNTSVPIIPERHQQLIVYGALMKMSTYLGNMTLFDTYSIKYAEGLGQLMREANPPKSITKRPIV